MSEVITNEPLLTLPELKERILETLTNDSYFHGNTYDANVLSERLTASVGAVFNTEIEKTVVPVKKKAGRPKKDTTVN